jgi:glutamate synthase domain-containing protein 3
MVALEPLVDPVEIAELRELIERHGTLTGSARAAALLADWDGAAARFVRVIPHDYRRVLEAQGRMRAAGLTDGEAEMAAFEENAADLARVGGS